MRNNASLVYSFCLVIGDFLALVAAFIGGYLIRGKFSSVPVAHPIHAQTYFEAFLVLLVFWIFIFALLGLYNTTIYEKRFQEAGRLLIGSFIGLLFVIFLNFLSNTPLFPAKLVPIYGFILAFVFLVIFRNVARLFRTILFSYNIGLNNLLIVGNTDVTSELVGSLIDSKRSGYRILGVVSKKERTKSAFPHLALFDTFSEAIQVIGADSLHSIVQTELYAGSEKNNEILTTAQENHIAYRFVPGNSELFVGKIEVNLFRSIPVVAVHQTPLIGWGRVVKRMFDLFVASFLLILTSPFLLIIAILVKALSGGGSVFFRQVRLTRFNQEFKVFKFRTQYAKYDGTTPEEAFKIMGQPKLAKEYRENGDFLANDPRVTPIGKFLRRSSLDELPQLLNVVRGDLSLVGPRALIPQELNSYTKRHAILSVKSGITGLAQVSGRRRISFEERRQLDMYYVQNWSFWYDIVIILKTVRTVFTGDGAK